MLIMANADSFCYNTANVWQIIGYVLTVFKIVIPLLLIIFGMFDLGKAVTSSKEDEIKKATMGLMRRAIAAVVIFFIPTLVGVVMGLVDGGSKYKACAKCLTRPNETDYCAKYAGGNWAGTTYNENGNEVNGEND